MTPPAHGDESIVASHTAEGEALVVWFRGEVVHGSATEAQRELERLILTNHPKALTLDLTDVKRMDSSGLALLVIARRRLPGAVRLRGVSTTIRGLLRATKLDAMFTLDPIAEEERR